MEQSHLCMVQKHSEHCVVQCVYADMRGNVLVHSKVPSLGLHAVQWAVVSWAASQKQRETVYDAKYLYRQATIRCLYWWQWGMIAVIVVDILHHASCPCLRAASYWLQGLSHQGSYASLHP